MNQPLKDLFMLDPEVVYLNHGSYGATARPVFDVYQDWQRRLEREPVRFMHEDLPPALAAARAALGAYLNAAPDDLVYVPNATFGVNVVAHSLRLAPGDEVLATDHEYGAVENIWGAACRRQGAVYVRRPLALPASSEDLAEALWSGVTPRTRVVFLSHITSPTALRLPVEEICVRARAAGILSVVDGAHAPGQIALDLATLGADFYVGNCHKWLCSPKGAGFLYTRAALQHLVEPPVVGWGWGEQRKRSFGSDYLDALQWLGTNDLSAYLAVPAAIRFQAEHDWPAVRARCHALLGAALERVTELTGLASLYRAGGAQYHQMAVAELPPATDVAALKARLYAAHRIEIPCLRWRDRALLRISVQGYNTERDIDRLLAGLAASLGVRP